MSRDDEELTRDSDLYQDAMRTKVINGSEYDSQIVDIVSARHAYNYKYRATWKSLSETGTFSKVSDNRMKELSDMGSIELAEEAGKTHGHTWRASGSGEIVLELKLRIELPDGEKVEFVTQHSFSTLSGAKDVSELIIAARGESAVDIEIKENDSYVLQLRNGADFEGIKSRGYYDGFSIRHQNSDSTEALIEYLESGERWVESVTKKPIESDDSIVIPIQIGDKSIGFEYDSPDSNDDFWDVVDVLGSGDPLLVDEKKVYVSHVIFSSSKPLMTDNLWVVRREEPTRAASIFARLREYFS